METLEDVEMNFYSGEKIIKSSKGVKIFDQNGQSIPKEIAVDNWNHYVDCLNHCLTIERTLRSINTESECFPVIIGRRPNSVPILSTVKEFNSPNALTPKLSNVSYDNEYFNCYFAKLHKHA